VISESKEKMIVTLIEAGLSERAIAAEAGVARGTVRSRKAGYRQKGHWGRCGCGAWVLLPCRVCQLRQDLGVDGD
jgi:hypothetical protein